MLLTLKGTVGFSTGRIISFDHNFQKGLTAITGANESGKSLRLEMIRYALFGTKALRDVAASYSVLDVTLEFMVTGAYYKVIRSKSDTSFYKKLDDNYTKVATGTLPVNISIINTLGYNLEVFDVANACLQDDITAMTKKTPAERKRMIDKTLGLDSIDTLLKEVSEKLSSEKTRVLTLEQTIASLGSNSLPLRPDGYESKEVLSNQLNTLISREALILEAKSRLAKAKVAEPQLINPGFTEPEGSLEFYSDKSAWKAGKLAEISLLKSQLKNLPKITDMDVLTDEELIKFNDYVNNKVEAKHNEYNKYVSLQTAAEAIPLSLTSLNNLVLLKEKYEPVMRTISTLENSTRVTCPNCNNEFLLAMEELEALRAKLPSNLSDIMAEHNSIGSPNLSTIHSMIKILNDFSNSTPVERPSIEYLGSESSILRRVQAHNTAVATKTATSLIVAQIQQLESEIAETPDYSELFTMKKCYIDMYSRYQVAINSYSEYKKLEEELLPKIQEENMVSSLLVSHGRLMDQCADYDLKFAIYQDGQKMFNTMSVELEKSKAELERLNNIYKGLKDIKPKVKSYLVPSLSAVASNFLAQMTSNKRKLITITEDFDITVDGQSVNSLSGSGKSVANIAIRLALGTVLTNKIFSVFMADEIDAAMDQERAESTTTCLRNLTTVYSQVILISHKKPEADNYIELT